MRRRLHVQGEYSIEATKEAEAAAEEGEAVDLPEVYDDWKDEATRCDVMTEEMLVPVKGAPLTGWRVDRFRQSSGRRPLVSTPLWSLRYPMCSLWLIIGKAALRDEGERYADDRDAFAAQEERCSSWRRAKRGGVVACGVQGPLVDGSGKLPGAGSAGDGHACLPCAPVRVMVVSWRSVLAAAVVPVLRFSCSHERVFLGTALCPRRLSTLWQSESLLLNTFSL